MALLRLLFCIPALALTSFLAYKTCGERISSSNITRVEMNLSAFGVESDSFPSIDVHIDFVKDSNSCYKSYYNPAIKSSTYKLSSDEVASVFKLLNQTDWSTFKPEYRVNSYDLPTSTITIHRNDTTFVIKDYGLNGDYPLKELYKIVYKF